MCCRVSVRSDWLMHANASRVLPHFLCCRVRCHIVHLSSAQPLQLIREAREAGAPLTVETTHHYLSLTAEDVPAGATQFKCCPPIRGAENQVSWHQDSSSTRQRHAGVSQFPCQQEQLWSALRAGLIDMVVSDHSPCTPELKKLDSGDFGQAWGGISSLQFGETRRSTFISFFFQACSSNQRPGYPGKGDATN